MINEFMTRNQEYTKGEGESLQYMVLRKLDNHMQKNETRSLSYTIHKK